MNLSTPHCRIRCYTLGDLDSLVKYANDPLVACQLRDRFPHPYTREIGQWFLEHHANANPCESFAIEHGGEVVGGVGVHPGHDVSRASAEIGYWFGRPFWGRGFATEVVRTVVEHLLSSGVYCRLHAHTFAENTASQRVLEKCGFEREGVLRKAVLKNGKLMDAVLYGRVDEDAVRAVLERETVRA